VQVRGWLLAVGAVALAAASGIVGGVIGARTVHNGQSNGSPAPAATVAVNGVGCDVTDVATRVMPALVTINVQGPGGAGIGSGSVLDKQGNILTNNHVIEAAATGGTITVDFARAGTEEPAAIVGRDPATDLAVIRVPANGTPLNPISTGDSGALEVGQPVVAAGAPLGLTGSITSGIVSALSRYVDVGSGGQPATLVNAIQTDAAINPGNSGGPLTDCAGRQIGVNSAGAQVPGGGGGSIGLNFAIPIDFARSVADQIIATGSATHPVIGVLCVTVTDEMAKTTGLPRGALVEQAVPGFGAYQAGIREGDVITSIGGTAVNSVDQMIVAIRTHQPGETIAVGYVRGGAKHTAQVLVS
jgi:putative serine protease PepD